MKDNISTCEVKICPHCGSNMCTPFYDSSKELGFVVCNECSACIVGETIDEAVYKWNKRFVEIKINHV